MWYTNQSTNIIITFMGKGHVHSFVSMVKKYSMFKNANISDCGTILMAHH